MSPTAEPGTARKTRRTFRMVGNSPGGSVSKYDVRIHSLAIRKDVESVLPTSMQKSKKSVTWYERPCRYAVLKWPKAAAKTRASTADALTTVTPALVRPNAVGRPSTETLRRALIDWAFSPPRRQHEKPADISAALDWIAKNSVPLSEFNEVSERARLTRIALDACATKLDGGATAATTAR
jgi:hypothetical protein